MVGHTLVILWIDVTHVYQRVAHLILSTIGVCADNGIDGLVTHGMDMHGDAIGIGSARDVGQFLFSPVGEALMSVGIQRIHIAGTAFNCAVHEEFEPASNCWRVGIFSMKVM